MGRKAKMKNIFSRSTGSAAGSAAMRKAYMVKLDVSRLTKRLEGISKAHAKLFKGKHGAYRGHVVCAKRHAPGPIDTANRPEYASLPHDEYLEYLKDRVKAMDDTTAEARMRRAEAACNMNRVYWYWQRQDKKGGK